MRCRLVGRQSKLPALVGDNMILQQQTEVKLWGTAAPEAEVRVTPSWNGQTMTCRADKDGGWTLAWRLRQQDTRLMR